MSDRANTLRGRVRIARLGGPSFCPYEPRYYLEQDDDRKLYVRYVDEDDPSSNYRVPLHEVLENPSSHAANLAQERIFRMFEERWLP